MLTTYVSCHTRGMRSLGPHGGTGRCWAQQTAARIRRDLTVSEFLDLQGKSAGSKLRSDGRYDVTLRLVSLRREQRIALEQTFANPKPPTDAP